MELILILIAAFLAILSSLLFITSKAVKSKTRRKFMLVAGGIFMILAFYVAAAGLMPVIGILLEKAGAN